MPELAVAAPEGAIFEYEEVKTAKGASSLGHVPILVWKNFDFAAEFYGKEGLLDVLDGTSLRVSFQSIARRYKIAGKSDEDIATAMINFRPGKRAGGVSTPVSRSARLAKTAADKLGDNAGKLEELLQKVASGEISMDDLAALVG